MRFSIRERFLAVKSVVKGCLFPDGLPAQLGVILAGISALALLNQSIQLGLSETFFIILDWYNRFTDLTLGWIGNLSLYLINLILSFLNISLDIYPHWKHIFILMNVYFIRDAATYYKPRGKNSRFYCHLSLGISLALFFSIVAGLFSDDGSSYFSSLLVAVLPLVGIFLYDWTERYWYLKYYRSPSAFSELDISQERASRFYKIKIIERASIYFIFSLLVTILWYFSFADGRGGSGVVAFLITIIIMSLYWVSGRSSLYYQQKRHNFDHLPWPVKQFSASGTSYLGGMMLGTFFWLIIFLLSNSGLGLVGL